METENGRELITAKVFLSYWRVSQPERSGRFHARRVLAWRGR